VKLRFESRSGLPTDIEAKRFAARLERGISSNWVYMIQIAATLDDFMAITYEGCVYILNLFLVFTSETALDIVLNSLAMEFVANLDEEFVGLYFDSKTSVPMLDGLVERTNSSEDAPAPAKKDEEKEISLAMSCVMILLFVPAVVLLIATAVVVSVIIFLSISSNVLGKALFPLLCATMVIYGPICMP
jgi:hypothetical protein